MECAVAPAPSAARSVAVAEPPEASEASEAIMARRLQNVATERLPLYSNRLVASIFLPHPHCPAWMSADGLQ